MIRTILIKRGRLGGNARFAARGLPWVLFVALRFLNARAEDVPVAPTNFSGTGTISTPSPQVNTNGIALINANTLSIEGEDHLNFTIGDQEYFDDNLFRIPASFPVATDVSPNASRGDAVNDAYLDVDGQWTFGRQSINFDARGAENRFARNTTLDSASFNGELLWNWRVGSFLSGQAGSTYSHALAAYTTTRYFGKDLVDAKQYFGTARFDLGPHWALLGGVRQLDTTHSAAAAETNDFRSKSGNVGVEYGFSADNTAGIEYRYIDGHYPFLGSLAGQPFDSDYRDRKTLLTLKYALTGKTVLDAVAGYVRRDYPFESIGKFSGDIWRASVQWQPTGKVQVIVSGWHELQAYLDAQSDYFISKGESISPVWLPTEKLTFSLIASRDTQDYITNSPSALALGSRHDTLNSEQASVAYTPWRALSVGLSIRAEQRKSTEYLFNYDDKLVRISVSYKF